MAIDQNRLKQYACLNELAEAFDIEAKRCKEAMETLREDILKDFEVGEGFEHSDDPSSIRVEPVALFEITVSPVTKDDAPLPTYVRKIQAILPHEKPILVRRTFMRPKGEYWASPADGYDKQDVCDVLVQEGLGDYVRREFHTGQLSGYIREEIKNDRELPDALKSVLKVYEKFTISLRRS